MKIQKHTLAGISAILILSGCGLSTAPSRPSFLGDSQGISATSLSEFKSFLAKSDQLQDENKGESFAGLLVQSQVSLIDTKLTTVGEAEKGRCVMVVDSNISFSEEELQLEGVGFSPGQRVAYSKSPEMEATECQDFFRDTLQEKFQAEFFSLHISFFSL